ncbi:hypothetical protein HZH68_010120 [Vespula germanica]|uniref:Uncharacterized protein n=1 Tax=Vespula germanica TaxID=30212 RepID=A0A834JXP9_VESGE|nr:hypothetical protein HZH68_010120 [Vespula germanica]
MLGVGFTGLVRFCGLMDPSRFLTRKPYDRIVESIQQIALAIVQLSMMKMQNRIRLAGADKKKRRSTKQASQEKKRCFAAATETERTLKTILYSIRNL